MRPGEQLPIPEEAVDEGYDPSDFGGPLEWYWHFSQRADFQTDSEQLKVLTRLERLLELLIANGVVLVMTSNYRPDDLYPHGLQRSRFLPAIEILKHELDVVDLAGTVDHRRRLLDGLSVYYSPIDEHADSHLARFFEAMTKATFSENGAIAVGGRDIAYRRRGKGVILFDFAERFEETRSQVDYPGIASA